MATIFRPTAALRCASKTLTLDKALFDRVVSTAAAVPRENQLLAKYTKVLDKTNEVFRHDKTRPVVPHPDEGRAGKGERVLILDPKVKPESKFSFFLVMKGKGCVLMGLAVKETWSKALREASEMGDVSLIPYEVPLDYSHWNYRKPTPLFPPKFQILIPYSRRHEMCSPRRPSRRDPHRLQHGRPHR